MARDLAGNHFLYGLPKLSMNATPQCPDYEVGSPVWSFFHNDEALPDHRLAVAQLKRAPAHSSRSIPFQGHPNAEFLGCSWMALPFIDAIKDDPPMGDVNAARLFPVVRKELRDARKRRP